MPLGDELFVVAKLKEASLPMAPVTLCTWTVVPRTVGSWTFGKVPLRFAILAMAPVGSVLLWAVTITPTETTSGNGVPKVMPPVPTKVVADVSISAYFVQVLVVGVPSVLA